MNYNPLYKALYFIVILSITATVSGCVVKDVGNTVQHAVKGDYYLQSKKYQKGQASFKQAVRDTPDNALARYYYGRFLLLEGHKKQALKQFGKALQLDPKNADYHFWTGLAYNENGDRKNEAKHYRKALSINGKHLQSLIYMGHNLLEKKQYSKALPYYNRALDIWPGSPSSLYNRALIMKKLGRTPEEKIGWHEYLSLYPSGGLARKATANLNLLGDFSYRNHHLGARTITIEKIWFKPFSAKLDNASKDSLTVVGTIINNLPQGSLQVVTYQKNNKELAKKKAISIKRYLVDRFPQVTAKRISISWFSEPQTLLIKKRKKKIDESVSFFITK